MSGDAAAAAAAAARTGGTPETEMMTVIQIQAGLTQKSGNSWI